MTHAWLATILQRCRGLAEQAESATDGDLLSRFLTKQDESAFDLLMARHAGMVWSVCRGQLSNDADAEDAFQATFVALATQGNAVRKADALGGWLHGTALRISKKAKRSFARRLSRERKSSRPETVTPAIVDATWVEWQSAVDDEIHRLPAAAREAFVACVLEGQRHQDLANRLGVAEGTISARVSRARQTILDRLTARGLTLVVAAIAVGGSTAPASVPITLLNTIRLSLTTGTVPSSITALSQLAIEGVTMKTKLLAAAVLIGVAFTGGTIARNAAEAQSPSPLSPPTAVGPKHDGQPEVKKPKSGGFNPLATLTGVFSDSNRPNPKWLYSLVPRPETVEEFARILQTQAANNYEFIGTESFGNKPMMVFKMTIPPAIPRIPAPNSIAPTLSRSNSTSPTLPPPEVPVPTYPKSYSTSPTLPPPKSYSTSPTLPPPKSYSTSPTLPPPEVPEGNPFTTPPAAPQSALPTKQPMPNSTEPTVRMDNLLNTKSTSTITPRVTSPLKEFYDLQEVENVTIPIPVKISNEKLLKACAAFLKDQAKKMNGSEFGMVELHVKSISNSKKTYGMAGDFGEKRNGQLEIVVMNDNSIVVSGPKPIVEYFSRLVKQLIKEVNQD